MKSLALFAGSLALVACTTSPTESSSVKDDSSADAAANPAARWVCNEYDRADEKLKQRTVVLAQTDTQGLVEGSALAFSLEMYEGAGVSPKLSVDGKVEHEDVMVDFQSDDGKVGFNLYLDEMNESSLTLDGEDAGDFVCRAAQAVETKNASWSCNDYDRGTNQLGQRTVVLSQTDGKGMIEGEPLAFMLEAFSGAETFTDAGEVTGTVATEDVMVHFTSDDSAVTFGMYLDEMNESTLNENGVETSFICR